MQRLIRVLKVKNSYYLLGERVIWVRVGGTCQAPSMLVVSFFPGYGASHTGVFTL